MRNTGITIETVQQAIETALQALPQFEAQLPDVLRPLARLAPPQGARAQVSLRHARTERKVKRNAPADTWTPRSGSVSISYCTSQEQTRVADITRPDTLPPAVHAEDPVKDMVLALARAEATQPIFVSLKWFRDAYLPQQGYAWAAILENRQRVLVEAINRRWILTSKVENPKNPRYPVTAIKANRPLADVRKILGEEADLDSAFAPITIAGEPLSETVLQERR